MPRGEPAHGIFKTRVLSTVTSTINLLFVSLRITKEIPGGTNMMLNNILSIQ